MILRRVNWRSFDQDGARRWVKFFFSMEVGFAGKIRTSVWRGMLHGGGQAGGGDLPAGFGPVGRRWDVFRAAGFVESGEGIVLRRGSRDEVFAADGGF